ncbi:hypothetical protein CHS0354_040616 [Potamilus streckersoni]|uniref:Uncharacterized protein n=1 Tax=Potamilus streckersoni TaxID=2493646 RepID=A0AAE0VV03_9BIVA|nr:hypothetical protein CHS0354_040616 [Potamilus streckersoni]
MCAIRKVVPTLSTNMVSHNSSCTLLLLFILPVLGQMTLEPPATTATEKKEDASPQDGGINLKNSFFLRDLSQGKHQTILDFSRFGGHLQVDVLREALLQEWQRSFGNPPFRTGSNAGRGWGIRIPSSKHNSSTPIQPQSSNNETQIFSHDAIENSSSLPFSSNQTRNRQAINDRHQTTGIVSGIQRNTDELHRNSNFGATGNFNIHSNDGLGSSGRPSSNTQDNTLTDTFSGSNAGFPRSRIFDVLGGRISDSRGQGDLINSGTSISGIISVTSSPIKVSMGIWEINMNNGTSPDTDIVQHPSISSGHQIVSNDSSMPVSGLPISESRKNSSLHKALSFGEIFTSLFGESATQVPTPLGETGNGRVNFLDAWNNTLSTNINPLPVKSGIEFPQRVSPNFQGRMPSSLGFSDQSSSENFQQNLAKDNIRPAMVDINGVTQNLQQKHLHGLPGNDSHKVFAGGPRIILTSTDESSNQELSSNKQNLQTNFDSTGHLMGRNAELRLVTNTSNAENNLNILSMKDMPMDSEATGLQNLGVNNGVTKMNLELSSLNQSLVLSPSARVVEEESKSFLSKGTADPIQSLVQSQNGGLNITTSAVSSDLDMSLLKKLPPRERETFGFGGIKSQNTGIFDNMDSVIKREPGTLMIPNEGLTLMPKDENIANIIDNQFHSKEPIVNSSIFSQDFKIGEQSNPLSKAIASVKTDDGVLLSSPSASTPNVFDSAMKTMVHDLQTINGNQFKKSPQLFSVRTQTPSDSSITLLSMTRPFSQAVEKAVGRKETMGETKLSTLVEANVMKDFPTSFQAKVPSLRVPDETLLKVPDIRTKGFIPPASLQGTSLKNNNNFFIIKNISLNPNSPQNLPMGFQLIQGSWNNAKATNEDFRNGKKVKMNLIQELMPQTLARSTGGLVDMQPTQLSPPIKMMKQSTARLKRPISTRYRTTTACD